MVPGLEIFLKILFSFTVDEFKDSELKISLNLCHL